MGQVEGQQEQDGGPTLTNIMTTFDNITITLDNITIRGAIGSDGAPMTDTIWSEVGKGNRYPIDLESDSFYRVRRRKIWEKDIRWNRELSEF